MRVIPYDRVVEKVARLAIETNNHLPQDVLDRLKEMRRAETAPLAVSILDQIIANAGIAAECGLPLCQDTGVSVVFADLGEGARVDGDGLEAAVNEGVRRGYREGGLRNSMVNDPLERKNTGDNTPAILHLGLVSGDRLRIRFCPKGGGCENMSRLAMLTPGQGREGVIDFVTGTVRIGGGRPCPPLVIGVGIGGNFERAALLAKEAVLRTVGERHPEPRYADLERELLDRVNALGIGPMGFGGNSTAIDVFVAAAPCHIASLPVAVNIQCHSARHGEIEL